ncbi:MAG: IclR family transcriptional regulator [Acidovorax sp.]|jgi:DNA-binding IclR family transcriptional regulator|nr:IclR family transcriptional regulator [Acidovorax sp.]
MDKERAGIQSVEVGFTLLQALGRAPGALMLKDLAAAAGMGAAKAHRYLVSFQRLGLVVQDGRSGRYDLGPAALHLGLAALARQDAVQLARERLPALMDQVQHTLALAVWGNQGPTLVHWMPGPQAVVAHLRLGDVMPLLDSATGRCFAAWLPTATTAPMLKAELQQAPARQDPPPSPAALQSLWAEVRAQGAARVDGSLLPGTAAFCAPVFDASGQLALGVLCLGPSARFDARWQGAVHAPLSAWARQLSHDLGHAPAARA